MSRKNVQYLKPFLLSVFFDATPQNFLLAPFMHAGVKGKAAAFARLFQSPSGKHARNFGYVLLGIAAAHAQRVQFHQFAAVIFVKPMALALPAFRGIHADS